MRNCVVLNLTPYPNNAGAGGTGKSAVVHALQHEFKRLGLGRLLVTAYTGVAAAPFAGPTLLKLLNLNITTKLATRVIDGSSTNQERMRRKFANEAGAPIEEFGGVVIDEISFIDTSIFGHVDKALSILLGANETDKTLCGGIPLLLCGDNHQKPPPGGTPWYQYMTKVASKEMEDPIIHGSSSAKQRGLLLLKAARRVDLKRLMRAKDDSAFIDYQMQMRQTELLHPVPEKFLDSLSPVTVEDLNDDPAWQFAPTGVLSHVERDYINLSQLHAFAKAFNLPIIRWRCELADGSTLEHHVREDIYNHEPNLWSYFVEGAPVLLLETISSVRMLVNGSPGLLDSLTITNSKDLERMTDAYTAGYDVNMITLDVPPDSVNIICGATKDNPVLWHEVIFYNYNHISNLDHLSNLEHYTPLPMQQCLAMWYNLNIIHPIRSATSGRPTRPIRAIATAR